MCEEVRAFGSSGTAPSYFIFLFITSASTDFILSTALSFLFHSLVFNLRYAFDVLFCTSFVDLYFTLEVILSHSPSEVFHHTLFPLIAGVT